MALFWDLPVLPRATWIAHGRERSSKDPSLGYRTEQASMTMDMTLIKSDTA